MIKVVVLLAQDIYLLLADRKVILSCPFKDDIIHIGGIKITLTEINNSSGSEDVGG
jgi:hypothetical protein